MPTEHAKAGEEKAPRQPPTGTPATTPKPRPRHKLWVRVVLLMVAIVVGFFMTEGVIRLARPGFPGFRIPQIEHRPAAGLGFEMVPNQVGYTFAERATVNSQGFRGPELKEKLKPGGLRVLCIGDSMTYGVGVSDEEVFARRLEKLLSQATPQREVEVINAGVQRYFTYQEIDFLKARGLNLKPDVVILVVIQNDLGLRPKGDYTREYEKEREQMATGLRQKAPWLYTLIKNSALLSLGRDVMVSGGSQPDPMFFGKSDPQDDARWAAMEQEIETFKKLADEHGFRPLVIAIPHRLQVIGDYPDSLYPARILEYCQRHGLPAIDPRPEFRKSFIAGVDPYLPWDNHLSVAGNEMVATALRDELAKEASKK